MKLLKTVLLSIFLVLACISCKNEKTNTIEQSSVVYQCPMKCEGEKTYAKEGSCPVCNMDIKAISTTNTKALNDAGISDESIFNLTTSWNTEEDEIIKLEELKGKTLVVVMIYTTCKAACPRLVADMRNIEAQIPDENIKDLRFVLVSIDPETDTPKRLKAFAKENFMDDEQWTFLQGTESGVREFANVLSVKYKEISPMDFSHSNIISVFNTKGELIHQQQGLGVNNKETVKTILELTN